MSTLSAINEATGFANGDKWETEEEIREYFTVQNLQECLWQASTEELAALPSQATLDSWADEVIAQRWHCATVEG